MRKEGVRETTREEEKGLKTPIERHKTARKKQIKFQCGMTRPNQLHGKKNQNEKKNWA